MKFNSMFVVGCIWIAIGIMEYGFSKDESSKNSGGGLIIATIITIVYALYKIKH